MLALLQDFGIKSLTPVTLYCDNKSALYITSNPVFHGHTKHIEIVCHLVREGLLQQRISTAHLPSHLQPADVFTKALSALITKLGVHNLFQTPNLRGHVNNIEG